MCSNLSAIDLPRGECNGFFATNGYLFRDMLKTVFVVYCIVGNISLNVLRDRNDSYCHTASLLCVKQTKDFVIRWQDI